MMFRLPKSAGEKHAWAEQIGRDGWHLLTWLAQPEAPPGLAQAAQVCCLETVWQQQYSIDPAHDPVVRWREKALLAPAAERVTSPHDPEARYSSKGSTEWVGYKLHVTETCDPERPHLVTHVETTLATEQDIDHLETIHDALAQRQLLPKQHLVDSGYVSSEQLVKSQTTYGIQLLGPVRPDVSWQAQSPHTHDARHFQIDWQMRQVRCPQGTTNSLVHEQTGIRGNPVVELTFLQRDCTVCPARSLCTRGVVRVLTLLPQAEFEALQARRDEQHTESFRQVYALRSGVEGTISQAVNTYAARRTRYRGLAKTHLQHVATAVAINLECIWHWMNGIPLAKTRVSAFAALAA